MLSTVMQYLRGVQLHVPFRGTMAESRAWTSSYDVEAWRADGYAKPLAAYRHASPQQYVARVDPEKRAVIENRLATFGEHAAGLGKFTRTMFAQDLRRAVHAAAAAPANGDVTPAKERVPTSAAR
jgi:hypothetical protein